MCAKKPKHTESCLRAGNNHLGGDGYIFRQLEEDSQLQAPVPIGDVNHPDFCGKAW